MKRIPDEDSSDWFTRADRIGVHEEDCIADPHIATKHSSCFRVYTHTSNAPLTVSFPASPPDSRLVFDGATGNAPAHVALPAAFEGAVSCSERRISTQGAPNLAPRWAHDLAIVGVTIAIVTIS
jgi:hypothetical protein